MHAQLLAGLRPLARQLRLRTSVTLFAQTAWIALGVTALFLIVCRFVALENYLSLASVIVGVWFIGWLIYSAFHRRTLFEVARHADAELELRDRLASALAFSTPGANLTAHLDQELVARQQKDALERLQRVNPREAFPLHPDPRRLFTALGALAVIAALLVIPNPMDRVLKERREIMQAARAQAQKIDEVAQAIAQNKNLDSQEQERLLEKLRELAAKLKSNPGDAKQALADIAKLQDALNADLDLSTAAQANALDALAQAAAQAANSPNVPRDANELAKLLEQLASHADALSSEQRTALAQALNRAAGQTAATNPNLAGALTDLAQALPSNALPTALQQAAGALQNAARAQALQESLAQALNQADASQQAMAQAANGQMSNVSSQTPNANGPGGEQGNSGSEGTEGQGGQGQGQGQGQGEGGLQPGGQGQGTGGLAAGDGKGGRGGETVPHDNAGAQATQPNGPNKPYETEDTNTVYAPFQVGRGDQQKVSGQDTRTGATNSQDVKSALPGSNNAARMPYSQVYQQYSQIAGKAMENSYIPSGLKDYVKAYFSQLEP